MRQQRMIVGMVAVLLAGLLFPAFAARGEPGPEILVWLEPGVDIQTIEERYGLTLVDSVPELNAWKLFMGDRDPSEVEELLESDEDLDRVEFPRTTEAPEGDQRSIPDLGMIMTEEEYKNQALTRLIRTTQAHSLRTGVGVTIALLDTAVSTEHPAIRSALLPGADFVGGVAGNGVDDDGDGLIDEGLHHGTYIAGLLHLAAPDAKILPIRVLEEDGRGRAMNLAKGILHAIHAGVDIINVSIGTVEDARVIEDAIELALESEIVVVAAAGNAGVGLVDFPANHPGVIGVGAVDHLMNKVSFSNFGPEVDLSAPGDSLFSTYGRDQYALWSGTSFATPLAAAGAALIKEKYPNLSLADVTTLLKNRVQPGGPGFTSDMGTGVVDLEALSYATAYERDTVRVFETETGTLVRWSPVLNATHYDVLRGRISDLRLIADGTTDATEMGAVVCLGNNLPLEPGAFDSERPQSGEVFFYVFRDNAPDGDGGHYGVNSAGGRRIAGGTDCATP